jgi:hypothetical protein
VDSSDDAGTSHALRANTARFRRPMMMDMYAIMVRSAESSPNRSRPILAKAAKPHRHAIARKCLEIVNDVMMMVPKIRE